MSERHLREARGVRAGLERAQRDAERQRDAARLNEDLSEWHAGVASGAASVVLTLHGINPASVEVEPE
jgi:hypothetical protein